LVGSQGTLISLVHLPMIRSEQRPFFLFIVLVLRRFISDPKISVDAPMLGADIFGYISQFY
jgi:hypothetical protein